MAHRDLESSFRQHLIQSTAHMPSLASPLNSNETASSVSSTSGAFQNVSPETYTSETITADDTAVSWTPRSIYNWPSLRNVLPAEITRPYAADYEAQQCFLPLERYGLPSVDQIDAYYKSFMHHLYGFYPFVKPSCLDQWVELFRRGDRQELQDPCSAIVQLVLALGIVCQVPIAQLSSTMRVATYPFKKHCHTRALYPVPRIFESLNMGISSYKAALETLNERGGSHNIFDIQGRLLAAIFAMQFAQTALAQYHISIACNSCKIIASAERYNESRIPGLGEEFAMTFWLCSHLEREIRTAFGFPSAGISRYEYLVPMQLLTGGMYSTPQSEQIQLTHIRDQANSLCLAPDPNHPSKVSYVQHIHFWTEMLELRKTFTGCAWHEHDPPSQNVFIATSKVKYFNALQMLHRPTLESALFDAAKVPSEDLQRCTRGAVETITAFDAVPPETFIPNVSMIAHICFESVLLLVAVYEAGRHDLVDNPTVLKHLNGGLRFMGQYWHLSPTLELNFYILQYIQEKVSVVPQK